MKIPTGKGWRVYSLVLLSWVFAFIVAILFVLLFKVNAQNALDKLFYFVGTTSVGAIVRGTVVDAAAKNKKRS